MTHLTGCKTRRYLCFSFPCTLDVAVLQKSWVSTMPVDCKYSTAHFNKPVSSLAHDLNDMTVMTICCYLCCVQLKNYK